MASLTQWTWVRANSGTWWWTGRPGVLQSMGLPRVRHDWATELNWLFLSTFLCRFWSVHSSNPSYSHICCKLLCIFPGGTSGKELACQCRRHKRLRFDPSVRKVPWRRAWQPTPVFLLRESQGQRSLVGYSQLGCKELDMISDLAHTHYCCGMFKLLHCTPLTPPLPQVSIAMWYSSFSMLSSKQQAHKAVFSW